MSIFPLELVAVISTFPAFLAIISPVELIVAIFSSFDFHFTFLSVTFSGVIVTVSFLLSPSFILISFSFILIFVATIVVGVLGFCLLFDDEELDVLLLLDCELGEYGQTPLVCK